MARNLSEVEPHSYTWSGLISRASVHSLERDGATRSMVATLRSSQDLLIDEDNPGEEGGRVGNGQVAL